MNSPHHLASVLHRIGTSAQLPVYTPANHLFRAQGLRRVSHDTLEQAVTQAALSTKRHAERMAATGFDVVDHYLPDDLRSNSQPFGSARVSLVHRTEGAQALFSGKFYPANGKKRIKPLTSRSAQRWVEQRHLWVEFEYKTDKGSIATVIGGDYNEIEYQPLRLTRELNLSAAVFANAGTNQGRLGLLQKTRLRVIQLSLEFYTYLQKRFMFAALSTPGISTGSMNITPPQLGVTLPGDCDLKKLSRKQLDAILSQINWPQLRTSTDIDLKVQSGTQGPVIHISLIDNGQTLRVTLIQELSPRLLTPRPFQQLASLL
ncbi:MAG: hypothetical protein HQM16_02770 [Deltaproteobacteria bacterium]|nr:hypothetical protein [Deltaproteobacteria bacterium]